MFSKSEPVYRGLGVRCGKHYVTAEHVVEPARNDSKCKVFVRVPGKNCLQVAIDEDYTRSLEDLDVAVLHVGNTATLLGVKDTKFKVFTPKAGTEVISFDFKTESFHCSYDQASWAANAENPYIFSTHSNTHGGDSGAPVFQGGSPVGIHIGSKPEIRANVHVATPWFASDWERVLKAGVGITNAAAGVKFQDIKPGMEGVKVETPHSWEAKAQQQEFAKEVAKRDRSEGKHREETGRNEFKMPGGRSDAGNPLWGDEDDDLDELELTRKQLLRKSRLGGLNVDFEGAPKRLSPKDMKVIFEDSGLKVSALESAKQVLNSPIPSPKGQPSKNLSVLMTELSTMSKKTPNQKPTSLPEPGGSRALNGCMNMPTQTTALDGSVKSKGVGEHVVQRDIPSQSDSSEQKPVASLGTPSADGAISKKKSAHKKLKAKLRELELQLASVRLAKSS